ncbi:MAG: DUF1540 domain-containing protein [Syntrophomonadaceae bacterium]|nr:DUF1540 domain-containing protein [Syntrophomonadaceae bacterium]
MQIGKQTITCSVKSCRFNDQKHYCQLAAIEVAPVQHVHNGVAEDESLCSSYEKG